MTTISATRLAPLLGPASNDGPAYKDLARRIRVLIVDGRLPHNTRLPSERELAVATSVSRTTSTRAYAELRDAGLVVSRRGSGSVVQAPLRESAASSLIREPVTGDAISLAHAISPAAPGLSEVFAEVVDELPAVLTTSGYLPDGLPAARRAVAARFEAQGVPTHPDQILITNGAMGALSLALRALLRRGDRVLVEGLGYPNEFDAIKAAGGRLSPLPIAEHPWDSEGLRSTLRSAPHRVAVIVPDFHNPTGLTMTADMRSEWAQSLHRAGVTAIVDETLRFTNLDGVEMPPSYAAFDPRSIVVGSASKEFWGGLRLGWARVPTSEIMRLVQARMSLDLGSSAYSQLVLARLLGERGEPIRQARLAVARAGRQHLIELVGRHLPDCSFEVAPGGLNLWLTLPGRISSALAAAAEQHQLHITPGPRFYSTSGGEKQLRLPYTAEPEVLTEGVRRLALTLDDVVSGRAEKRSVDRSSELIA